jgi:hypothetical protein
MPLVFAHVAGIPVEETVLSFAPVGLLAFTVGLRSLRQRLRDRIRGPR